MSIDVSFNRDPQRSAGERADAHLTSSPIAPLHRRSFFGQVAGGVYGAALASLLGRDLYGEETTAPHAAPPSDLRPRAPHFEPRARAVIHLYMNGGPSQMDLFDPKPKLDELHG